MWRLPEEGEVMPVALWNGDRSSRPIESLSITTSYRPVVGGIGGSNLSEISQNISLSFLNLFFFVFLLINLNLDKKRKGRASTHRRPRHYRRQRYRNCQKDWRPQRLLHLLLSSFYFSLSHTTRRRSQSPTPAIEPPGTERRVSAMG